MLARRLGSVGRRMAAIAVAGGLTVLGLPSPANAAATLTVCASGCDYTGIQSAVDAAAAGDTIEVGPGTYAEAVSITKAITLDGAGMGSNAASNTIIAPASGNAVTVAPSSGATLDGVTITGVRVTGAASSSGIYVVVATGQVTNLTISQVTATGSANSGIRFNGADPTSGTRMSLSLILTSQATPARA